MMQQGITYSADANASAKSGIPAEGEAKAEQGQATQAARGQAVKEKVIEYCKRTLFLVVGLAIMSFGVALSIQASLGTSPISGIPYVLNLISGLSVGTTTIIVNVGIVALQVILLRRRFKLIGLLQIPVCIVFGLLTDVALVCIESVTPSAYWAQWLICLGGILLVAVGVSFEVAANVTTLPGEGLVLTICTLLPKVRFGYMKVAVDCSLVIIAAALSFIFMQGLHGVREGTVGAAILVGLIARLLNRFMLPFSRKIFAGKGAECEKSE